MAKQKSGRGRRQHGAKCPCCSKRHGDGAPWWNAGKSGWSLSVGKGRNRLLAKGRDVYDREAHDLAMQKWVEGQAGGEPEAEEAPKIRLPGTDGEQLTTRELVDLYLDYLKKNARPTTYEDCVALFQDLCDHRLGIGDNTVAELRVGGVSRVKRWAEAHPGWGNSTLSTVYARVKAVFNYAANSRDNEEALDLISSSPIRKLNTGKNRLRSKTRVSFFTPEQEALILAIAGKSKRCPQFATAFKMLITTGCRPEEFCSVTAADVRTDETGNLYWWVRHKNEKHTGDRRRVYLLTDEAEEITRQQMEKHPEGVIFRNGWGLPWTKANLLNQLRRITKLPECQKLGLDDYVVSNFDDIRDAERKNASITAEKNKLPVPKERREYKYVIYTTRHTFGYRWANGIYGRELTYQRIADLMGNSAKEVERTYGHVSKGTPDLVQSLKLQSKSAASDTDAA